MNVWRQHVFRFGILFHHIPKKTLWDFVGDGTDARQIGTVVRQPGPLSIRLEVWRYTSSLVMRALYDIRRICSQQRWWKTFSRLSMFAVSFHASEAYVAVGMTMAFKRQILARRLMVFDRQMEKRRW